MDEPTKQPKRAPLPAEERGRLVAYVDRVKERGALAHIGCDPQTLARAMAGLPVNQGTAALIRERLAGVGTRAAS